MRIGRGAFVGGSLALLALPLGLAGEAYASERVQVRIDTSEPDAVLAILDRLAAHATVSDAQWQSLFGSEGYLRLKKREAEFRRAFPDDNFRAFVSSPELIVKKDALRSTLATWTSANIAQIADVPLRYLPAGATIRATVYPLIKPRTNSFVYELDTNPAIMLYLDPQKTKADFENEVAHELFHIGDSENCPPESAKAAIAALPGAQQNILNWLGAFGEGAAVLAAAGGPNIHPHASGTDADRARWDRDLANFPTDVRALEAFFLDILDGRLKGDAITDKGFTFFGYQGPWYTVGWKIFVSIENTFGRARVIETMCDRRQLFATYNDAAQRINASASTPLPLWSPRLTALFH